MRSWLIGLFFLVCLGLLSGCDGCSGGDDFCPLAGMAVERGHSFAGEMKAHLKAVPFFSLPLDGGGMGWGWNK